MKEVRRWLWVPKLLDSRTGWLEARFGVTYLCSPTITAVQRLKHLLCMLLCFTGASSARADAMLQLFNLTWTEVTEKIPEIAEAGYSSLWLPPPTKGGGELSIGYDLFDPFDLGDKDQRGTVRTRYGAKEELQRMVATA